MVVNMAEYKAMKWRAEHVPPVDIRRRVEVVTERNM